MNLRLKTAAALAAAVAVSGLLLATPLLSTGARCAPVDTSRLLVLRVDGTSLSDWANSQALGALLPQAAAAAIVVPREITTATYSSEGLGDPSLASRRRAAQLIAHLSDGPEATVVSSSPGFEPLLPAASSRTATIADATRPTRERLDSLAARTAIETTPGAVEIDISDTWRVEHDLRGSTARDRWLADSLGTVAVPLIEAGRADARPILLVSLLPSVARMRQGSRLAAVAMFGPAPGLLADPTRSFAPGLIPLGGLGGLVGGKDLCVDEGADGGLAASELDRSLVTAERGHLPAVAAILTIAILVILASTFAITRGRLGSPARSLIVVLAAGLLFIPAVSLVEGTSVTAGVPLRAAALVGAVLLGTLLLALRDARTTIGIASLFAVGAPTVALLLDPLLPSRTLIASPIANGLRTSVLDAVTLGAMLAGVAIASAWATDRRERRSSRAVLVLAAALGVGAIAGLRGGIGFAPVLLVLAAFPAWPSLPRPRLTTPLVAIIAGGVAWLIGGDVPGRQVLEGQPPLWPLLVLAGIVAWIPVAVAWPGDRVARAIFGRPGARLVPRALTLAALWSLAAVPQGTASMAAVLCIGLAGATASLVRR